MKTNRAQQNIPNGWKEVKLSSIGTFLKGASISKEQLTSTGHNAIRYGELYTKYNFCIKKIYSFIPDDVAKQSTKVQYGDIIFAGSGETIDEIGKSAAYLLKEDAYASGDTIIFRPNSANSLFLAYFLNVGEARKKLRELGQGQSVVHIYKTDIENLVLALPPLEEQNRIASILETWDQAIERLTEKIKAKKNVKIGLLQDLLTGKKRLSGFNEKWNVVALGEILKERNERGIESPELPLYSLTIVDGVCPKSERYDRSFLVKSDEKSYKKSYEDDIVYNPANLRYGAIARNKNRAPVLLSPIYQIMYIKDKNLYDIDFLGQLLTWERQVRKMSAYAEGTLIERMEVKIDSFKTIQIDIPNYREQKAISKVLMAADKEIAELEKKSRILNEQKRFLLDNLITGNIRVTESIVKAGAEASLTAA